MGQFFIFKIIKIRPHHKYQGEAALRFSVYYTLQKCYAEYFVHMSSHVIL